MAVHDGSWRDPRRWIGLLHDAALALLIAFALKFVLDASRVSAADTFSWRVFNALTFDSLPGRSGPHDSAVVLINDAYFEGPLKQASPLDRGELAKLLDEIAAGVDPQRRPVVAIDLDLSHAPTDDAVRAAQLDAALVRLAGRARVVLLCPFARTPALREKQVAWSRGLLSTVAAAHPQGPGLDFAASDLVTRSGVVMTYGSGSAALGAVAGRALRAVAEYPPSRDCGQIEHRPVLAEARPDERDKIAPAGLSALHRMPIDSSARVAERLRDKPLRAVFVGGSYALAADQFLSAASVAEPGVVFHAAVAYSIRMPVREVTPGLNFVLQLAGVMLVLSVGHAAGASIFRLMTPAASTPPSPVRLRWLQVLWSPDPHLPPPLQAEGWLRWLVGMLLLVALLAGFVAVFMLISGAVFFGWHSWFDGLLGGFAAWLKVLAGDSQHLLAQARPHEATAERAADTAGPPATPATNRWLGASALVRAVVLAVGAAYLIWKFLHGGHA